jgi:hypothetical protein
MRLCESVELAAWVAEHGRGLIVEGPLPSSTALRDYWIVCRSRLDRWHRGLRRFESDNLARKYVLPSGKASGGMLLFCEIFVEEILIRVWTAVVTACESRQSCARDSLLVRHVLSGHQEVSRLAANRLAQENANARDGGKTSRARLAQKLDQLRLRSERWSDLLLAHLHGAVDVRPFAFDLARLEDFADSIRRRQRAGLAKHAWSATLCSLQASFRGICVAPSPNADLSRRIGSSILVCFPGELSECTGPLHSLWMSRLAHHADDAANLVDELMSSHFAP